MYDYLAKIILLGPSGTGKFVDPILRRVRGLISLQVMSASPYREK